MLEENRTDDAGNEQEIRLPPDLPDNGHDSDHPSIWMPFSVFIDGRELEGVGISLVAAYVGGWGGADIAGRDLIARFSFQFDGYSIVLPIEVRAGLEDRRSGAYKLVFLDPTGPHLAHLRYLMNAYLAGDLVQINEVLRIPPEYKKKPKQLEPPKPPTVKERLRKVFGLLWVGALTVALITLTVWTIHYHIFVHKVPGRMTWPNITLKRGITQNDSLIKWLQESSGEQFAANKNKLKRSTAAVTLIGPAGKRLRAWEFDGAFPIKWTGPNFSVDSTDMAMEQLEILANAVDRIEARQISQVDGGDNGADDETREWIKTVARGAGCSRVLA